jgi:hypothetical protein
MDLTTTPTQTKSEEARQMMVKAARQRRRFVLQAEILRLRSLQREDDTTVIQPEILPPEATWIQDSTSAAM